MQQKAPHQVYRPKDIEVEMLRLVVEDEAEYISDGKFVDKAGNVYQIRWNGDKAEIVVN